MQTTSVPGYPHIHLSLSIGGILQTAEDTMETAVHCASRLMYQAKEHKNTVIVASSSAVLSAPATLLPRQSRQQILIADDSAMNRMLLAEILGPTSASWKPPTAKSVSSSCATTQATSHWCCWTSICRYWTASMCCRP